MAPRAGFEPATHSLTGSRSTVELPGNNLAVYIIVFRILIQHLL